MFTSKTQAATTQASDSKGESEIKRTRYHDVTIRAAQANSAYWGMLERMYREQAARTFQRSWRKKHNSEYKGKYSETLNGSLTMHFIKEPFGQKYLEHAKFINCGKWMNLDLEDKEFKRNIYKALRLKLITPYQLSTASALYEAYHLMKDEKGNTAYTMNLLPEKPAFLSPKLVSYASNDDINLFNTLLNDIPKEDRVYFSIIMPLPIEILFLFLHFRDNFDYKKPFFKEPLINHIKLSTCVSEDQKEELLGIFDKMITIENTTKLAHFIEKRTAELTGITVSINIKAKHVTANVDSHEQLVLYNEILLFQSFYRLYEQMPSLGMYNKSRRYFFILPSTSVMVALQKSVHHHHTTYPLLTVGKLSPMDMLDALMDPNQELRPVELVHPDIRQNEMAHGCKHVTFSLTQHDWFHIWRNGANPYKDFFRFLITNYQIDSGYKMSQFIWYLVDMDFSIGQQIRNVERNEEVEWLIELFAFNPFKLFSVSKLSTYEIMKRNWICYIFEKLSPNNSFSSEKIDQHDTNLSMIINMIKEEKMLKYFLGEDLETCISKNTQWSTKYVMPVIQKMKNVIATSPPLTAENKRFYYYFVYQINELNDSRLKDLVIPLANYPLSDIFEWSRNDGITIKKSILDKSNQPRKGSMNLVKELPDILEKYFKAKSLRCYSFFARSKTILEEKKPENKFHI